MDGVKTTRLGKIIKGVSVDFKETKLSGEQNFNI